MKKKKKKEKKRKEKRGRKKEKNRSGCAIAKGSLSVFGCSFSSLFARAIRATSRERIQRRGRVSKWLVKRGIHRASHGGRK